MRLATAYSSFCSQTALVLVVYLHLFHRNLLLKCAPQTKIAKKTLKPLILGFKIIQGHRC